MTDKGITLTARLLKELAASITDIGESYTGVCDSGMTASKITIVCDDIKDFGDDYFNDGWLMYIAHNDDAPGTAPEGETRDITGYVSTTGTFTTAAFSADVEEDDVVIVARVTTFIIDQVKLIVSPVDGSLASFISSGNGSTSYGSRIGINKSIIDAIGADGIDAVTHDFSEAGVVQYAHGKHTTTYTLFIIPEAVASISAHNAAIQADLEKLGRVITITQSDALGYPDFISCTLCVLGTDNGTTAWNTANLADLKTVPDLPKFCCDSAPAAYLEMGTANADVAAATIVDGITNIEASMIGTGIHEITGFDAGDNIIAVAGTSFASIDMSNANITETVYAIQDGAAGVTDVMVGFINRTQVDASTGTDEDGNEVPATLVFYGPACSYNFLNILGQGMLSIICLKLIHGRTIGLERDGVGSLQQKIFGNMAGSFKTTTPMVEYFAGQNSVGAKCPIGKSLVDIAIPDSGTGTLNDANTSDTIVPSILPASKVHITFDINNLNNNGDDFDIEVKVGVAASERVVSYYNLTSDGTDITADTGSGIGAIIKQRRIDISDILVYTGEQVVVELTKNSATDRNVPYNYVCGV